MDVATSRSVASSHTLTPRAADTRNNTRTSGGPITSRHHDTAGDSGSYPSYRRPSSSYSSGASNECLTDDEVTPNVKVGNPTASQQQQQYPAQIPVATTLSSREDLRRGPGRVRFSDLLSRRPSPQQEQQHYITSPPVRQPLSPSSQLQSRTRSVVAPVDLVDGTLASSHGSASPVVWKGTVANVAAKSKGEDDGLAAGASIGHKNDKQRKGRTQHDSRGGGVSSSWPWRGPLFQDSASRSDSGNTSASATTATAVANGEASLLRVVDALAVRDNKPPSLSTQGNYALSYRTVPNTLQGYGVTSGFSNNSGGTFSPNSVRNYGGGGTVGSSFRDEPRDEATVAAVAVHTLGEDYASALRQLDVVQRMYNQLSDHNTELAEEFKALRESLEKIRIGLVFDVHKEAQRARAEVRGLRQYVELVLRDYHFAFTAMAKTVTSEVMKYCGEAGGGGASGLFVSPLQHAVFTPGAAQPAPGSDLAVAHQRPAYNGGANGGWANYRCDQWLDGVSKYSASPSQTSLTVAAVGAGAASSHNEEGESATSSDESPLTDKDANRDREGYLVGKNALASPTSSAAALLFNSAVVPRSRNGGRDGIDADPQGEALLRSALAVSEDKVTHLEEELRAVNREWTQRLHAVKAAHAAREETLLTEVRLVRMARGMLAASATNESNRLHAASGGAGAVESQQDRQQEEPPLLPSSAGPLVDSSLDTVDAIYEKMRRRLGNGVQSNEEGNPHDSRRRRYSNGEEEDRDEGALVPREYEGRRPYEAEDGGIQSGDGTEIDLDEDEVKSTSVGNWTRLRRYPPPPGSIEAVERRVKAAVANGEAWHRPGPYSAYSLSNPVKKDKGTGGSHVHEPDVYSARRGRRLEGAAERLLSVVDARRGDERRVLRRHGGTSATIMGGGGQDQQRVDNALEKPSGDVVVYFGGSGDRTIGSASRKLPERDQWVTCRTLAEATLAPSQRAAVTVNTSGISTHSGNNSSNGAVLTPSGSMLRATAPSDVTRVAQGLWAEQLLAQRSGKA